MERGRAFQTTGAHCTNALYESLTKQKKKRGKQQQQQVSKEKATAKINHEREKRDKKNSLMEMNELDFGECIFWVEPFECLVASIYFTLLYNYDGLFKQVKCDNITPLFIIL